MMISRSSTPEGIKPSRALREHRKKLLKKRKNKKGEKKDV